MKNSQEIDIYIAGFPKDTQVILRKLRAMIRRIVLKGEEAMTYGIPTIDQKGGHVVHFAAFKKHIGLYPTPSVIVAFKKELAGYKTSKGAIQFPLDQPLPWGLITKIVRYRVKSIK